MPVEPPVVSPRTLAEAYAILAGAPHRPVAGGTDLLVQLTGEIGPAPERVIDLWRVEELRGIRVRDGALELGALTTYTQIRGSDACSTHAPALVAAAATIGAAQIQNRGTIGGNVMNASPAGDTLPVLLALDASLVVGGPAGERTIPAAEFWPAYRRTAIRDGELLLRVRIPIVEGRSQAFRKVGTRRAQAISKVVRGGRVAARPGLARRPDRVRVRRRDADPGAGRRGSARGRAARLPRPSTPPSRRFAASSIPSTTYARPAPTASRSPAGSCGASWRTRVERDRGQPVRQVVDPPRQGRQAQRPPRAPRPDRRHRARRRLRGLVHRRRQHAGHRDRHHEEHRLRVRAGAPHRVRSRRSRSCWRGTSSIRRRSSSASVHDRRARVGAAGGRHRAGARRVPAHGGRDAHGLGRRDRIGRRRRVRRHRPRRDEDREVGVHRVPARPLHDAERDRRPDHGDQGHGDVAPRRLDRRLGRQPRGRARDDARDVRRPRQRVRPALDLDPGQGDARAPRRRSTRSGCPCPTCTTGSSTSRRSAAPNRGEIFVATLDPHGLIEATVRRGTPAP